MLTPGDIYSSVDPESEKLMMSVIRERFDEVTVISVAHHIETLMDFDRVLVVDNGQIIEEGAPRRLLDQETVFKSLYESSLRLAQTSA